MTTATEAAATEAAAPEHWPTGQKSTDEPQHRQPGTVGSG